MSFETVPYVPVHRRCHGTARSGRATLHGWLRTVLSTPAREFPDFPAGLSLLDPRMVPAELRELLEARVRALEARLAAHEGPFPALPRMFLLEEEYMAAIVRAEIAWLGGVIDDLRAGRLVPPTEAELRKLMSLPGAPSGAALQRALPPAPPPSAAPQRPPRKLAAAARRRRRPPRP